MSIVYREMRIEDYDQVLVLWQSCEGIGISGDDNREGIQRSLQRNPGLSFVAIDAGHLVGAVLCGQDGRRGYINHLAVYPDYRRRGIGAELVRHCLSALERQHIGRCHIFVYRDNENALKFWEKIGWTERKRLMLMSMNIGNSAGSLG